MSKETGMDIEVVAATTWYTVYLSEDDVNLVKQWIRDHKNNFPSFNMRENITEAVNLLFL